MHALSTTAPLATPPRAAVGAAAHGSRTLMPLQVPILRTLLRLAGPNVLVMLAQSSTGLIEAHFVGRHGIPALAGMALVFPGIMQMMSAGAVGGGISSAIARPCCG